MPSKPPSPPSKEERLAKALRDNLARRKALARSKKARSDETGPEGGAPLDAASGSVKGGKDAP